jgi:hypothetical protein
MAPVFLCRAAELYEKPFCLSLPGLLLLNLYGPVLPKEKARLTVQTKQGEILNEKSSSINHWKWSIA